MGQLLLRAVPNPIRIGTRRLVRRYADVQTVIRCFRSTVMKIERIVIRLQRLQRAKSQAAHSAGRGRGISTGDTRVIGHIQHVPADIRIIRLLGDNPCVRSGIARIEIRPCRTVGIAVKCHLVGQSVHRHRLKAPRENSEHYGYYHPKSFGHHHTLIAQLLSADGRQ